MTLNRVAHVTSVIFMNYLFRKKNKIYAKQKYAAVVERASAKRKKFSKAAEGVSTT